MSANFPQDAQRALRVLVTGSAGVIGQVLTRRLAHEVVPYDLPDGDVRDRDALASAATGADAIVHLAWNAKGENFRNGELAPENLEMTLAVLEVARDVGVRRVVLASSVHADTFWPPREVRLHPHRIPTPDSPYGASKVWIEAYGRHVAGDGVEVVAIRFGGVNLRDAEPDESSERAVWLPHADCVTAVEAALCEQLPPTRYALIVAVGDDPARVHAFSDDLEWRPRRAADDVGRAARRLVADEAPEHVHLPRAPVDP